MCRVFRSLFFLLNAVCAPALPLSFAEFCELKSGGDKDALFAEYMQNGGLPYIGLASSGILWVLVWGRSFTPQ